LLGYRETFDEVYATSAGGVNAAYFLSGQGSLGITVYFDDINNFRFINPFRLSKIADVDFVYDYIVPKVKTLDEQAIRQGRAKFFLSVTEAETGRNVLLETQQCSEPVSAMLKASSALPVLYNRVVILNNIPYVDGGLSDVLPIDQAIRRGCTDILVLLSKPSNHTSTQPNVPHRLLFFLYMGRKYPCLVPAYKSAYLQTNRSRKLAFGEEVPVGVNIATIAPSLSEDTISRTTLNREKLLKGAYLLAQKTFRLFGGDLGELDKVFHTFKHRKDLENHMAGSIERKKINPK
jgi:predicted patatin/cPLA2 family phospholipase